MKSATLNSRNQFCNEPAATCMKFGRIRSFAAFACVVFLAVGNARAQDQKKQPSVESRPADSIAILDTLQKLKLNADQEKQVNQVIEKYDASMKSVWQQFSQKYMEMIVLETTLMTAVEDNLTDAQRARIRELRRNMAQIETAAESPEKPATGTAKAVETVSEELAASNVTLTEVQEEMADKIQEKYRTRLRGLNRNIQSLHVRLLSIEADKIVAIEKVLTKEQLAQLRELRQAGPALKPSLPKDAK